MIFVRFPRGIYRTGEKRHWHFAPFFGCVVDRGQNVLPPPPRRPRRLVCDTTQLMLIICDYSNVPTQLYNTLNSLKLHLLDLLEF